MRIAACFGSSATSQPVGRGGHGGGHLRRGATRVDDREALGLGRREGQEPVADAAVEGEVELGLEARDVAGRLARQADLDRQVEQDRQVGREAVGRGRLERAQRLERDAGAVALVGERRVGEAGADDGPAGRRAPAG